MYPSLTILLGPMFAGKSSALLQHLHRRPDATVFIPALDTRSGLTIKTHDGQVGRVTRQVQQDFKVSEPIDAYSSLLIIDELQFFPPTIVPYIERWLAEGKDVVCAGLLADFRDQPWPIVEAVRALKSPYFATQEILLLAKCGICGFGSATLTRRREGVSQEKILVGGAEHYYACCNCCDKKES